MEQLDGKWEVDATSFGRVLHNASLFASKDQTREILTCVNLSIIKDTLTARATDSYVLSEESVTVSGTDTDNVGPSVNITAKDLAPVVKHLLAKRYAPSPATLLVEGKTVTITANGASFTVSTVVGDFPRFDLLWPEPSGLTETGIVLNPTRLVRFAKIIECDGSKHADTTFDPGLVFFFTGDTKPVLVISRVHGSTFRALVMPK